MRIFFATVLTLVCVGAHADSLNWSDSAIFGPKYTEILAEMERLHAAYPEITELVDYGKSVQGRTLRMMVVRRNLSTAPARRPTLVMTGSTHGNEYLNIEDRLPAELLRRTGGQGDVAEFIDRGGAFVFVPILNPDGYDNRRRENAKGTDLNRDWDVPPAGFKGFKEVETRLLAQTLHGMSGGPYNLQYRVTIDYHCCIGALLHPWSYTKTKLNAGDLVKHVAIGEVANQYLNVEVGTTPEVLGYSPLGTTKDYYYDRYSALAFTYEGRRKTEKDFLDKHIAWWEGMVSIVMQEVQTPFLSLMKGKAHPYLPLAD